MTFPACPAEGRAAESQPCSEVARAPGKTLLRNRRRPRHRRRDLTEDLVERLGGAFALWGGGRGARRAGHARVRAGARGGPRRGSAGGGSRACSAAFSRRRPSRSSTPMRRGDLGVAQPARVQRRQVLRNGGHKLSTTRRSAIEALLDTRRRRGRQHRDRRRPRGQYLELVSSTSVRRSTGCGSRSTARTARCSRSRHGASAAGRRRRRSPTSRTGRTSTPAAARPISRYSPARSARRVRPRRRLRRRRRPDAGGRCGGREVDGDQILAVLALHLGVDLVAVTEMTNLGFHRLMAERRHPRRHHRRRRPLRARGAAARRRRPRRRAVRAYDLPGRPHDRRRPRGGAPPLLVPSSRSGDPGGARRGLSPFPQAKANVRVRASELARLEPSSIASSRTRQGARILVRPSGTEPVVRVLAEAETAETAGSLCYDRGPRRSGSSAEGPGSRVSRAKRRRTLFAA